MPYKPYSFQMPTWQLFLQQGAAESAGHALLLHGPKGVGKMQFAQSAAAYLLCETPQEGLACGGCRGCHHLKNHTHPDYFEITALPPATTIKVDQIRRLTDQLSMTPQGATGRQVVVVQWIDSLHTAAANAFLKTLEEPLGHVSFLLLSEELSTVMPTVLSRCQRLSMRPMDAELALDWMQTQRPEDSPEALRALLQLAHQAPLAACAYAQADYRALRSSLLTHLTETMQGKRSPIAEISSYLAHDPAAVFGLLHTLIADVLYSELGAGAAAISHQDCMADLQIVAQTAPTDHWLVCYDTLAEAQRLIQTRSHANVQLLLESFFITCYRGNYVC